MAIGKTERRQREDREEMRGHLPVMSDSFGFGARLPLKWFPREMMRERRCD